MKKWSVLPVVAALLFSASALATEGKTVNAEPKSKICTEIRALLKNNNIALGEADEKSAWVRFTVNEEREIVVLTVRTDDEVLERFVRATLNYHSVENTEVLPGEVFEVPIRFTS